MTDALSLDIAAEEDRLWASGAARKFVAARGFSAKAQAELAVCVAEIASNIAKYAGTGRIELTYEASPSPGCRLRATDDGPGIAVVDAALRDGFSNGRWLTPDVPPAERRGLGVGLGAVQRLLSDVKVSSRDGGGLVIEAVLWRNAHDVP